jgi:transcriptional antiterminator RfaH
MRLALSSIVHIEALFHTNVKKVYMQCACRGKQIKDFAGNQRAALRMSMGARQVFDARQKSSGKVVKALPFGLHCTSFFAKIGTTFFKLMREVEIEIVPGLRWYALRSKPNREKEVAKRLADLGIEVFLPWLRTRRRRRGRMQWVLVPLFPGYLFSWLDLEVSGKTVRYVPGMKDFLKFGSHVAEVSQKIIDDLRARCPGGVAEIDPMRIAPGEHVRIQEGPFAGVEAIFQRALKDSERVAVLLEILGRQTRLELPAEAIEKV